jgi:hypothetical protein
MDYNMDMEFSNGKMSQFIEEIIIMELDREMASSFLEKIIVSVEVFGKMEF